MSPLGPATFTLSFPNQPTLLHHRPPSASRPSSLPNILLIVAGGLGYSGPGCYGQQRINTPVLDRLAANPSVVARIEDYLKTARTVSEFWPLRGN